MYAGIGETSESLRDGKVSSPEVVAAFDGAVGVIENLGYAVGEAAIPFGNPDDGLKNIERDREIIAEEAFGDFDV